MLTSQTQSFKKDYTKPSPYKTLQRICWALTIVVLFFISLLIGFCTVLYAEEHLSPQVSLFFGLASFCFAYPVSLWLSSYLIEFLFSDPF